MKKKTSEKAIGIAATTILIALLAAMAVYAVYHKLI